MVKTGYEHLYSERNRFYSQVTGQFNKRRAEVKRPFQQTVKTDRSLKGQGKIFWNKKKTSSQNLKQISSNLSRKVVEEMTLGMNTLSPGVRETRSTRWPCTSSDLKDALKCLST